MAAIGCRSGSAIISEYGPSTIRSMQAATASGRRVDRDPLILDRWPASPWTLRINRATPACEPQGIGIPTVRMKIWVYLACTGPSMVAITAKVASAGARIRRLMLYPH